MKKLYTLALLACTSVAVSSQNLVPNPGFETQDTCPSVSEIWKAPPWVSATLGTPDLYNSTCSSQNFPGRTGIGSSGVYAMNTFSNNREYMIAPLTSPLAGGTTYYVSFWVKRANYRYAVDQFGAYFSTSNINQTTTGVLNYTPQVHNLTGNFLSSSTSWMQISGSFVAAGGESYIVIGNFSNDANTDTLVANSSSSSKVAYYMVDDISVNASGVGIDENLVAGGIIVYPTPASDRINVQADGAGSVTLLDATGRLVQNMQVENPQPGKFVLNVAECSEGVYFLNIYSDNGVTTKKVVITR
ncbi:MAG TPA: T9SS type A sorting domain-containing protein [Bacteroidia bacterium]|nr:T9SS type A sorting domain-containing protein [Bacteroidia bacterium]